MVVMEIMPAAFGGNTFGLAGNTGTHTFDTQNETLTFPGTGQINVEVATNFQFKFR